MIQAALITAVVTIVCVVLTNVFSKPTTQSSDVILKVDRSPGSINTVNQVGNNYINTKPPYILETKALPTSTDENLFVNQFLVTIGYPSDSFVLHMEYPWDVISTSTEPGNGGERTYQSGPVPYQSYLITFKSKVELDPSQFIFVVRD